MHTRIRPYTVPAFLVVLCAMVSTACAHGFCAVPNQRGTLKRTHRNMNAPEIDPDSELDHKPHFPAGSKDSRPGAGKYSQEQAAKPEGWTPFTPLQRGFKWRAGVCGDPKNGRQDHMRGGEYYNDATVVASYKQGGVLRAEINIIAHHNGFIEFHVCNVAKCGGEISEKCFKDGHCQQLRRARNAECDSGKSKRCAPIDPNYPGRWFLPCTARYGANDLETFGGAGEILYELPRDLHCEHCVLHWFWTGANGCNPPGLVDFFDSDRAPDWGACRGQGGAIGGVTRVQKPCGPDRLAEEYYQCIDIKIEKSGGGRSGPRDDNDDDVDGAAATTAPPTTTTTTKTKTVEPTQTPTPYATPDYTPPAYTPDASATPGVDEKGGGSGSGARTGVIKDMVLVADGRGVRSVRDGDSVDIGAYDKIALEAVTTRAVDEVRFLVDGVQVWTDFYRPYFMFGNRGRVPMYWKSPPVGTWVVITTEAGGDLDVMRIRFTKGA